MQRASAKRRGLGHSKVEATLSPGGTLPSSIALLPPPSNGAGGGTQPSPPPNPQPAPIPAPSDSTGGGGNTDGGTPTPTASPTSATVSPGSTVPSSTSPSSAPGNPTSSSGTNNASSSSSAASSSGAGGAGDSLGVGGGQSVTVNAGLGSSTATSAALGTSTLAALAAASASSSQYLHGSGSNTAGADSSSSTVTTSTAVSSGKQLSVGAIAGIIIVCLFFLLLLVLAVVRRRLIASRMKLRRKWWFGHQASRVNFSLVNDGSVHTPVASSARSSFVTNFDHGLMLRVDAPSGPSLGLVPSLPPMAEVRERNSILISTGGAMVRRESMNSMLSNDSEPDAQHLTVSGLDNWHMSVRPFSPSESFAFPKPPSPPSSTGDHVLFPGTQGPSSAQSSATPAHPSMPSPALMTDHPPPSVSTPSLCPKASTSSLNLQPFFAAPNPSLDPFADPEKPVFADIEVICRAFNPSLPDELAVRPGDRVRPLQIFDDGWVSIEKLASVDGQRHERGLIPVACLPEACQALPAFPTQKRESNYGSDQLMATAL